jgi:hypothetical protein
MTRLIRTARGKIPTDRFAGPGRSFPVEDKPHARAAIVDSARSESAGNISKELEERIKTKAERVLNSAPKRRGVLGKKPDDDRDSDYL